jgi:predicted RNA-binding Zn-ribbon protein involved in translation (DUF1610 family)
VASDVVPSSSGPGMGISSTCAQVVVDTGSLTSKVSSHLAISSRKRARESLFEPYMPESPRASNSQTYTPKLKRFKPNTQTTLSSAIVPLASTSDARAYRRFYNSHLRDVYSSCALPTETVFAASHTILSSSYSVSTEHRSAWSHTTHTPPLLSGSWPKTSSLSLPFLAPVSTAPVAVAGASAPKAKAFQRKGPKILPNQMVVWKMSLRPSISQRQEIKHTAAVCDSAYNFAQACVHADKKRTYYSVLKVWRLMGTALRDWRSLIDVNRERLPPQYQPVASKVQAQAIKQLFDAHKSNSEKQKKRMFLRAKYPDNATYQEDHVYEVRPRTSASSDTRVMIFEKHSSNLKGFRPVADTRGRIGCCLALFGQNLARFGPVIVEDSKRGVSKLVDEGMRVKENVDVLWEKATDKFFLLYRFVRPVLLDPDPLFLRKRIVAADPGVYPFQAWYSPTSGQHGTLIDGFADALKTRIDTTSAIFKRVLARQFDPTKHTQRTRNQFKNCTRQLRRRLARERLRIREYTRNAHYDAIKHLMRNHDIIIMPVLHVCQLVANATRGIRSVTASLMQAQSHMLFRQRLQSAAFRYAGRHVYETEEPGTSKTCTHCGHWHAHLRVSDKTFHCPSCGIVVNRQTAGARNNFFAEYGKRVGVPWDGLSG